MTNSNIRPETWLGQRAQAWEQLQKRLPSLEDNASISVDELDHAISQYPEMARDLAIARRIAPNSRLTTHLDLVFAGLHRALFQTPKSTKNDIVQLFRDDIPAVAWGLRRHILSITLGFIVAGLAGWWLVSTYPEMASLFASDAMIDTVQSGKLWTAGLLNIMPSSLLSLQIFTNNIFVALTAMSLGVFYGLGTIYIIGLNGLMLGGVFAFTARYNLDGQLFEFVCAHGFVELTVICIAGAIGFSLGEALARPGNLTRVGAFQVAVKRGSRLMLLCVLFLIGAGIIEGYISPNPSFSMTVRLCVGIGYLVLFLFALNGWHWRWSRQRVLKIEPSEQIQRMSSSNQPLGF